MQRNNHIRIPFHHLFRRNFRPSFQPLRHIFSAGQLEQFIHKGVSPDRIQVVVQFNPHFHPFFFRNLSHLGINRPQLFFHFGNQLIRLF